MSAKSALKMMKDKGVKFVDFRFIDTKGKEQHVTVPAHTVDESIFTDGKMFDGSSIAGWKGINESDMILMPEADTAVLDPFIEETTMILRCDVIEPSTMQGYGRDPRSLAKRAEAYLKKSGVGDKAFFGPELEFFIFDSVRWATEPGDTGFVIESEEAPWAVGIEEFESGRNKGHRPRTKGGYFPVPPVDSQQDIRNAMCLTLEEMGQSVEVHHHEVGGAGQGEIGTRFNTLVKKADELLTYKYVLHNVAASYGKTCTFMPKPVVGDNGTGMHCHQSIAKGTKNLFSGNKYGGLSETALYYIGGILKHAQAINAFTNPTTNSYKRLVPGFEAPVLRAYSARNRSASVRIPWVSNPKARRIEVRFPDGMSNPYFAFSAMLMAGLDGIKNKIKPGAPMDKDLYSLPPEEEKAIPKVCHSLDMALEALDQDRAFLKQGGVFTDDLIDAYIALKMEEVTRFRMSTHPVEFDMYFSL